MEKFFPYLAYLTLDGLDATPSDWVAIFQALKENPKSAVDTLKLVKCTLDTEEKLFWL